MEQLIKQVRKHRSLILYGVFGVLTTAVNVVTYCVCYYVLTIPNLASTAAAWLLAVIFAFVTNKIWVFDSKSFVLEILVHELTSFFFCRVMTGLLDMLIMYIAVDLMMWNELLWKVVSNVLVIILNFAASKLIIFKSEDGGRRI